MGDGKFQLGDHVQKISGYRWPGIVVAEFLTLDGKRRYVVECTVPEVAGALHIYSEEQIRHALIGRETKIVERYDGID